MRGLSWKALSPASVAFGNGGTGCGTCGEDVKEVLLVVWPWAAREARAVELAAVMGSLRSLSSATAAAAAAVRSVMEWY